MGLVGRLNMDKPWEVTIKPHRKHRSLSQNAMLWKWYTAIAEAIKDHTGMDAEEVHEALKQKFLTPRIVEIDGEVYEIRSTKKLSTAEMTEYLNRIHAWATSELGLLLPLPSELGRDETGRAT